MLKIIFCIIILVWCLIGFKGLLNVKANRVNYEMIIFIVFTPFIPIVAKICNLY